LDLDWLGYLQTNHDSYTSLSLTLSISKLTAFIKIHLATEKQHQQKEETRETTLNIEI